MSDETCDCCEPTESTPAGADGTVDRWVDDRPVTDAPLPPDMARTLDRFYDAGGIETLGDFVEATRAAAGGSLAVEDLCHVDGETDHVALTADETYHFRCFYDGIALARLADEPVDVRTESPSGTPIELRASPDGGVDATPPGAVMSLGVAADVAADDDPVEAIYDGVCPYVRAFPSREDYREWAATVDGATVGMPLAAGVPVATALTA